ncbi:MAG: hypothetical protein ACM3XM_05740 [Mycobacterium leprae]
MNLDELLACLSPVVARYVRQALRHMEQQNVFDAPGVIGGVVAQMRVAESDVIRSAADRTEYLLRLAFGRRRLQRIGA